MSPSITHSVIHHPRNPKAFNVECARAHRRSASTCSGAQAHSCVSAYRRMRLIGKCAGASVTPGRAHVV
eukprot:5599740-Pleurochrysis_carterae.AAC.1